MATDTEKVKTLRQAIDAIIERTQQDHATMPLDILLIALAAKAATE